MAGGGADLGSGSRNASSVGRLQVLREADLQKIYSAALEILESVGMLATNKRALEVLLPQGSPSGWMHIQGGSCPHARKTR